MTHCKRIQPNDVPLLGFRTEDGSDTTFSISRVGTLRLMSTTFRVLTTADTAKQATMVDSLDEQTIRKNFSVQFQLGSLHPRIGILLLQVNPQLLAFGTAQVTPTVVTDVGCSVIQLVFAAKKALAQKELQGFDYLVEAVWLRG